MVRRWQWRRFFLLPVARLLVYPFALLFFVLALPFAAARAARRCAAAGPAADVPARRRAALRPPIQEPAPEAAQGGAWPRLAFAQAGSA
jgi:hypothetical protein